MSIPEEKPEPNPAPKPDEKAPVKEAPAAPKPGDKPPEKDAKAAPAKTDAGFDTQKVDAAQPRPARQYRNKVIFAASALGVVAAVIAAYLFGIERKAQPPVFKPVSSPFDSAIYANGIIESDQASGSNINIYPDVSGAAVQVLVHEGDDVAAGAPLIAIDDSVQRAATEQLRLQADATLALVNELKAEPRRETLAIAESQVALARANSKAAVDQYEKDRASFDSDPKSISKTALDTAEDSVAQAAAALDVAARQYDLTKAGAWSYDIANEQGQYEAQRQAYDSANALLQRFTLRAPVAGVVLAVNAALGGYVSPTGAYNPYTEAFDPVVTMGPRHDHLAVRCYVDEILISRLPSKWHIKAQMAIIGSDIKIPLEFVRVQPYVSPKIELSNERQEKVDLRVLPVVFRFEKGDAPVYPGQLVDVYIGQQ
jgi:HlyD family secretion protein